MSVGFGLLKSVLHNGADSFISLSDNGISADVFHGDERIVFSAIEQFYLTYGELPSIETIEVSSGVSIPWSSFPIEPIPYWIDQIKDRELLLRARSFIAQAQTAIGSHNLELLRSHVQQAYIDLEEGINDHSVQSIEEASRQVLEQHNSVQQNYELPGVPFAFPYLNQVSGGMWGGDIIALIGRPAAGKSYIILHDAIHAHNRGKKVLFVSMEMPNLQCARRILSLRSGVNYTRLRLGRVSSFGVHRLEEEIEGMSLQPPFRLLSGGIFGSIDRIYAQIKHYRPDVVYIDGAYLIRTTAKGGQRWERVLQVLELLKKVALSEDIPIYITFQFNKTAPGTLEGIAFSDGVSQLSSLAISLGTEGTDNASMSRPIQYRTLKILKGREGETGQIRIEMDFDRMAFSQNSIINGMSDDFEYSENEDGFGSAPDLEPVTFI